MIGWLVRHNVWVPERLFRRDLRRRLKAKGY